MALILPTSLAFPAGWQHSMRFCQRYPFVLTGHLVGEGWVGRGGEARQGGTPTHSLAPALWERGKAGGRGAWWPRSDSKSRDKPAIALRLDRGQEFGFIGPFHASQVAARLDTILVLGVWVEVGVDTGREASARGGGSVWG